MSLLCLCCLVRFCGLRFVSVFIVFVLFGEVLRSEIVSVFTVFVLFGEVLRSEIVSVFVACVVC